MVTTMKLVKGISLFIVYPLLFLGIGFYAGVETSHFFYPGEQSQGGSFVSEEFHPETEISQESLEQEPEPERLEPDDRFDYGVAVQEEPEAEPEEDAEEVLFQSETLCVDTEYVLEETDILHHTVVETTWRLPDKYVGMNRAQFLQAMEVYEMFPPLSELERGFVSLEVLSFSRERVVIQMNYKFVQPSSSFYLAVYDNEVIVYLEDMETVYIETEIQLDTLPEDLQQSIIGMMWVEDEEALYSFLENYSS